MNGSPAAAVPVIPAQAGTSHRIALIGSVGIPNRYGGFESFAEHIAPVLTAEGFHVIVTCERSRYLDDLSPGFRGAERRFIALPAGGALSPLHDVLAFARVYRDADYIVALGVSGGVFFPLLRLLSGLRGTRLLVNIDGVEWRRSKFGRLRRAYLWLSDWLAQRCAHTVIFDNEALAPFVRHPEKSSCVEYAGDHAFRSPRAGAAVRDSGPSALTICRIEPENNCEVLIEGFLRSALPRYLFVGNWDASHYGRSLREKYRGEARLALRDPTYDEDEVRRLRSACTHYLHGHSVGGTNPSLVEMLFFDCAIACWDCAFNRVTAGQAADYFASPEELAERLGAPAHSRLDGRSELRTRYSAHEIARKLIATLER